MSLTRSVLAKETESDDHRSQECLADALSLEDPINITRLHNLLSPNVVAGASHDHRCSLKKPQSKCSSHGNPESDTFCALLIWTTASSGTAR